MKTHSNAILSIVIPEKRKNTENQKYQLEGWFGHVGKNIWGRTVRSIPQNVIEVTKIAVPKISKV